jgi:uncharacterized protein
MCRNCFCFLLFLFLLTPGFSQKAIPELWGHRIHDEAKVLSQDTIDLLEKKLQLYEDSTSNQIAVLLVSSLDGETIEEYSLRIAESWKLGQKDKDNGVLVLVAVDDHKMRIEVGQGLEGVLTDALSSRIIRNEMAPSFRRSDYNAGIVAAIDGIIKAIGGEYEATDISAPTQLSGSEKFFGGLFIFGILGIFTAVSLFSKGFMGWFLYVFLIPFYLLFPIAIIGGGATGILLILYFIGMPIAKIRLGKSKWGKAHLMKWSGGGSSGWFSGGNWDGGGFSGGGGSFGGGGSSGSW